MQQSKDKDQTGSKTATDEEIAKLVAETRLSRALQKMTSRLNSKPSPTSTGKEPNE